MFRHPFRFSTSLANNDQVFEENPKSQIRNPKQNQKPKSEIRNQSNNTPAEEVKRGDSSAVVQSASEALITVEDERGWWTRAPRLMDRFWISPISDLNLFRIWGFGFRIFAWSGGEGSSIWFRLCPGWVHWLVLSRGLEPPQVAPYDPESYASTNSATRARAFLPEGGLWQPAPALQARSCGVRPFPRRIFARVVSEDAAGPLINCCASAVPSLHSGN